MKLLKFLFIIFTISLPIQASGGGFKLHFTMSDFGPGFGASVLGKIDFADYFFFYPNVDFWYSQSQKESYWDRNHWVYIDDYVNEIAFNIDAAFIFPVKPIQPYFGLGFAPTITTESWSDSYVNAGFNLFGGILFPMGPIEGILEFRGKFSPNYYNVFKAAFGIIFEPQNNNHNIYHRTGEHHKNKNSKNDWETPDTLENR